MANTIRAICVFCGSGTGTDPNYSREADRFGRALARRNIHLVYGGSNIGLMGRLSAAARDAGGRVTGVIPEKIAEHVPAQDGVDMEVVPDMHRRKARMYALADGFVSLPGGIGTLDETFEAWTWSQLGYHAKPLALVNIGGYYDALIRFLDSVTEQGFLRAHQRDSLIVDTEPEAVLDRMEAWSPPLEMKWERG